jgi:hypothetical protein
MKNCKECGKKSRGLFRVPQQYTGGNNEEDQGNAVSGIRNRDLLNRSKRD